MICSSTEIASQTRYTPSSLVYWAIHSRSEAWSHCSKSAYSDSVTASMQRFSPFLAAPP